MKEKPLPMTKGEFLSEYWLKAELAEKCRSLDLPASGSKQELTARICNHLEGKPLRSVSTMPRRRDSSSTERIEREAVIAENYRNDERHRRFFLGEIGPRFRFNVPFMNWMKKSIGQETYAAAINEWLRIEGEKRNGAKQEIAPQFEYNQYTRDFFSANLDRSRDDCIRCWNWRKSLPGDHRYHDSDLDALT